MSQVRLTDEEIQRLIECIQSGAEVPEDLLPKLSPGFFERLRAAGKFDYKELDKYKIPVLEYAGKRSESVILAQAAITGGAAPLQVVRSFGEGNDKDWRNMIVQGDNLQFLKTCYMNQDPLIKDKVKGKVKLIYIDPPFATKSDFGAKEGERSYSDKVATSEFVEALRERSIYLRELLADDGSIYLHLDQKMSHYVKILMDEIFGKSNFKNQIVWKRTRAAHSDATFYGRVYDMILFYGKQESCKYFNKLYTEHKAEYIKRFNKIDNKERKYMLVPLHGPGQGPAREFFGKMINPPKGRCWPTQKVINDYINKSLVELTSNGTPSKRSYLDQNLGAPVSEWWDDIIPLNPVASERVDYPTQKPEALLERIITASSENGDLVLDCFAGSGTTLSVAEKLGRKWIACDFGKHAIYTMQKRILNVADSNKLNGNGKKKVKYGKEPKSFDIISAGAYDFSKIMNLRANQDTYISFVLGLFGINRESVDSSKKYKLPNIFAEKEGDPVEVYPIWEDEYLKEIRIDEEYLQGIVDASGGKLKGHYYIVTPETCTVVGNTTIKNTQKEDVHFHMLKFPYKVLEDVSRQFQIEEQPSSSDDINKLISSTGFYFNEEVSITVKKVKNGFKIEDFSTMILDSKKERFKGREGLSMILMDNNYNGKVFNMDQAIYAKDIPEDGLVKASGISDKTAIIAIDKHGNESKILRI